MIIPTVPMRDTRIDGPATTERGKSGVQIMVSERRSLPASLIDRVRAQGDARLPELSAGRCYTARQLCGEEFWIALESWAPTRLGAALSYLACSPTFPLVYVGKNSRNHRLYVLR